MPSEKNKSALRALNVSHFFNDIYAKFVPTIMPLMLRDFSLNLAQLGFFSTYAALLSFFLQPVFGWLSDKQRNLKPDSSLEKSSSIVTKDLFFMVLGTVLSGIFISLITFVRSLNEMLIFLTIAAIGNAAFHPASVAYVGTLANKSEQQKAIAKFIFYGSFGAGLSPLLAYFLIGSPPQNKNLAFAIPCCVLGAILMIIFIRDSKTSSSKVIPRFKLSLFKLKFWTLILLVVFTFSRTLIVVTFDTFLPELFFDDVHRSIEKGAFASTVFFVSVALGSFAGPYFIKRFGNFTVILLSLLLSAPLFLAFFQNSNILILFLAGFILNLTQAQLISMAQNLIPEKASLASSLVMGVPWGFAVIAMPLLGFIADKHGLFATMQYSVIIFITGSLILTMLLKQNKILNKFGLIAILFFTFLSTGFLTAQAEDKVISIQNVTLKHGILKVPHNSLSTIKFAKKLYASPDRLVFDIYGARLKGPKQIFDLDSGAINKVTVAQFENDVVRVVIQSTDKALLDKVKIDNIGQSIYFNLEVEVSKIIDIKLKTGSLYLSADRPLNVRSFVLDNPARLVVDIIGSALANPALKLDTTNGAESIKVSQFNSSTTRIVLSGAKEYEQREIKISADEKQLIIVGGNSDKAEAISLVKGGKLLTMSLLDKADKGTVFIVESTKEIDYKFLYLKKPERYVLDLVGIVFDENLRANQFKPTQYVSGMRYGLATLGTPVTRVVFDLKNENLYADISTSVDKKTLTLTIIPTNKKDLITKPAVNDVLKPAVTDPVSTVPSDTIIKEGLPSDLPVHEKLEKKVVLDAGHGGYDPGALYDGHAEKDITLAIAKKTKAFLETAGVKVFMTRSEDRFLSLAERVEISKSISPNMFVSVHVNALATNSAMDGLQTYYYSDSGYELAKVMHKEILETGMPNRNIRKAAFWVCKHNKAPSVLLELGFMTNREERKKLASDKYQDQLAKHVAAGIIKYLNK